MFYLFIVPNNTRLSHQQSAVSTQALADVETDDTQLINTHNITIYVLFTPKTQN